MATITAITKDGKQSWKYTWTGTDPYDVYRADLGLIELTQTDLEEITLTGYSTLSNTNLALDDEEPPPLEIIDSADTSTPECLTYPPFSVLQWRGNADASYYIVQQYVGSTWTTYGEPTVENGAGYYKVSTGPLADVTTHNWRVLPVDSEGNQGDPVTFEIFMVRNPAPPRITCTYSSPNIVVSTRA